MKQPFALAQNTEGEGFFYLICVKRIGSGKCGDDEEILAAGKDI